MSFDEQAALKFLDTPDKVEDTSKLDEFLAGKTEKEEVKPVESESVLKPVIDYATGMNDQFLDLLGFPGDAFDWAAEQLGSDLRSGWGSAQLREYGKAIGMGTHTPGEEPDTGSYRAGEYTMTGLEFLAPFLQWAKASQMVVSADKGLSMTKFARTGTGLGSTGTTGALKGGTDVVSKSTPRLIGERMTAPFVASPKAAYTAELASGAGAGYGSYYGEQEFGQVGELFGGLMGGMVPVPLVFNASRLRDYALKSYLPYTPEGGKAKAASIIRQLAEDPNIRANIEDNSKKLIPGTKLTATKLTKDQHLMALEKVIVDEDPVLARELRIQDGINNAIARKDLTGMAGPEVVEEAQKQLSSKFMQLQSRLNARVDLSLNKVKKATSGMMPSTSRRATNIAVKEQLDSALGDARKSENILWNSVDKEVISDTSSTKQVFAKHLSDRFKEDDPSEIPAFLTEFLGKMKNGELKGGKWGNQESVGSVHSLRSRLLKEIRKEKSLDVTDWNKVRIMEDVEEGMLGDLSRSGSGKDLTEAINFSRELNKKFKGDIMSTIFRHSKTGGALSPELTLDRMGTGPKGAVHIKKLLDAAPGSADNIREVLKMDIVKSKIINNDRLDLNKAKAYMLHNEDTMELFPLLKSDMDRAIGLEEKARWFEKTAKSRMAKAKQSVSAKVAEAKPGTVLGTIMRSKYPEKEMAKQLTRLNDTGKAGIKNDIIDVLISKSKTSEIGPDNVHLLSGKKALGFWSENKSVLSKAFTKQEQTRIDRIIDTLRLGDEAKDLPTHTASESLKPNRTVLAYVVEVAAARLGAMFGSGTSGASLKTASQGANTARAIMGDLDIGTAKKLIKDSIQDPELFMALSEDMTNLKQADKVIRILQGWMVSHAIENLESIDE